MPYFPKHGFLFRSDEGVPALVAILSDAFKASFELDRTGDYEEIPAYNAKNDEFRFLLLCPPDPENDLSDGPCPQDEYGLLVDPCPPLIYGIEWEKKILADFQKMGIEARVG